jgi:opacity protein-like surface antigen
LAINVTKWVQIQVGAQMGYLLTATHKGSQSATGNATADKVLDFYNRFDYGFGGGLEFHLFKGLLVGARYNISLNDLYKESAFTDPNNPSSVPGESGINFKNNVVQLSVGYRF